jgi:hypothetical protein
VAVKVRRPGIGPLIADDLRALDWLLMVGETLTVIPPDVGRRFTEDFRALLFNELNFRAEVRYTVPPPRRQAQEGRHHAVRLFPVLQRRNGERVRLGLCRNSA